MALPATDDFNRDDGALGSNWAGSVGDDLTILSNVCKGTGAGINSMYWSADAPNDAQYAECKIVNSGVEYSGPTVRGSATDWVLLDAAGSESCWKIEWYDSGSWTQIGSTYSTSPATNDVGRIEADGTGYTGYINDSEQISGSNASAPSSGYGGLMVYANNVNSAVDDFEVGNLSSPGPDINVAVVPTDSSYYTTGVKITG